MPPTDSTADADTAPFTDIGTATSPGARESRGAPAAGGSADSEDTLDVPLPDEIIALFAEDVGGVGAENVSAGSAAGAESTPAPEPAAKPGPHPVLDPSGAPVPESAAAPASALSIAEDLLDHIADWGPISTPAGVLHLVPARVDRDLPIIGRWMNDPAVAAFWGLAGPQNATEEHLRAHLSGDGRTVPCLGLLEGTPMSYWEIYRADLDPLARHYPARPHDTGVHLLIGAVGDRGRGLGGTLLRAVADLAFDKRPACARIVAEPDIRNTPSVAAFLSAGFRFSAEVDLPAKRAALMVRDRSLRHLL
ncbi:GNAT family N-acetyltransferase [Streptomyces caeruleatus]|uniref:Lysine N-acyltransferase MbtK n=1 Tax=Streptomyces caeruleatus TaxID=661399 RepID=A0A101U348_9ACTN|nr:GNAT family N-acetyltransferase [Streptomyces caeruleatus]KUO03239.1 rhizobactin siderophore biosynthesis protein rhbD [Streptomyces caeruleatus]